MTSPSEQYNSLTFPTWPNLGEKAAVFDKQPWDWDVSADEIARIQALPKPVRKDLMTKTETRWNCYSALIGNNWFFPVSNENPPLRIKAFVVDYDLPLNFEHVQSACRERVRLGGYVPRYIETSLSGNIRCIWTFESPLAVAGVKFANDVLKRICELVEAENFLPGFDPKSVDCVMRWTNGGYWSELDYAAPIPAKILLGLSVKTSIALSETRSSVPFEKLEPLLAAKYPRFKMFNGGRLKMRANGLRFWEEGADNQFAAYVIDKGFFCVTGTKPVITWEELLGAAEVEGLRATGYGEAAKDIYYDGKKYFTRARYGFVDLDRADILLAIASHGFERSRKKDEVVSPAEQVLRYIQTEQRVDGAAPLLFRPDGVVEYQNRSILNISRAKPLAMADVSRPVTPADFPWLHGFFDVFFASPELRPKDYFFCWWRRFYRGAIEQKPVNGQAVFFCGPRNCGKNLISELVVPMAMGGSAPNPYRYLMGDTSFSDDIFSAPVLAINDEDAPPEHKKSIFEQKVKSLVANNEHSFHPKFMKSTRIEWDGRLIGTLNDGPKDIGLLPMLNPNTKDKMSFFRAVDHNHPFFDKHRNREIVAHELPYFLRWLVEVYEPPAGIILENHRIGVESYHDPLLVRVNRQEQISYNLLELLAAWMQREGWNGGVPRWQGTPTELLRQMTGDESLEQLLKSWDPSRLSKALGDLARSQTPGVKVDPESKGRTYIIEKAGVAATVQGKPAPQSQTQATLPSMAEGEE